MSAFWSVVQLLSSLALILAMIYLVLNRGATRWLAAKAKGKNIQLIEKMFLGPKHSIYLIEVEGRRFLLGSGDSNLSLIAKMDEILPNASKGPHHDKNNFLKSDAPFSPPQLNEQELN